MLPWTTLTLFRHEISTIQRQKIGAGTETAADGL
jgi:hypothetical protein